MKININPKKILFPIIIILISTIVSLHLLGIIKSWLSCFLIILLALPNVWLIYLLLIPNEFGKVKLRRFSVSFVLIIGAFISPGVIKFNKAIYSPLLNSLNLNSSNKLS